MIPLGAFNLNCMGARERAAFVSSLGNPIRTPPPAPLETAQPKKPKQRIIAMEDWDFDNPRWPDCVLEKYAQEAKELEESISPPAWFLAAVKDWKQKENANKSESEFEIEPDRVKAPNAEAVDGHLSIHQPTRGRPEARSNWSELVTLYLSQCDLARSEGHKKPKLKDWCGERGIPLSTFRYQRSLQKTKERQ